MAHCDGHQSSSLSMDYSIQEGFLRPMGLSGRELPIFRMVYGVHSMDSDTTIIDSKNLASVLGFFIIMCAVGSVHGKILQRQRKEQKYKLMRK